MAKQKSVQSGRENLRLVTAIKKFHVLKKIMSEVMRFQTHQKFMEIIGEVLC
jgi:hypothetical protein